MCIPVEHTSLGTFLTLARLGPTPVVARWVSGDMTLHPFEDSPRWLVQSTGHLPARIWDGRFRPVRLGPFSGESLAPPGHDELERAVRQVMKSVHEMHCPQVEVSDDALDDERYWFFATVACVEVRLQRVRGEFRFDPALDRWTLEWLAEQVTLSEGWP